MKPATSETQKGRIRFGKIREVIAPPNLIELQLKSFEEFLQLNTPPRKRKNVGLEAVFNEVFPISSYDGKYILEYRYYEVEEPKKTWQEALREGTTYGAPLYVVFALREEGAGVKEERVFMGEMPLMTPQASFVINGAERVVVSQLHRSPGIAYEVTETASGKKLYSFRIIPDRGSWFEAQFDTSDLLYVYLDRQRKRRKFIVTTFFRALSYLHEDGRGREGDEKTRGTDEEILSLFYEIEELSVREALKLQEVSNKVLVADVVDPERDIVIARALEPLSKVLLKQLQDAGINKVRVVDISSDDGVIVNCLKKDTTKNEEEALREIYRRLRPGDPPTISNARALLKRLFFDPKRYDLGRVGRYKINQKLGLKIDPEVRTLTREDLVAGIKYLLRLRREEGTTDDIDHLGSRRVRMVGELLANQCRVGLARTERLVKERMTLFDQTTEAMTPQKLINPKVLTAVLKDFFGRSPLSQLLDQVNPLSEITHKRRLSALGPGGLSREHAGFEVRDVHASHYGRICPIETPEGPNIGLIASLATYARINEFGFIETPYRKVVRGRVTDQIEYLTADQEQNYVIAQANNPVGEDGRFLTDQVLCRWKGGEIVDKPPSEVDYMDVSPKQIVSVAASLIPFLEHDDANRALMGSNMQRQAVPLLVTEAPIVGTGMEEIVARDSRAVVVAEESGIVASATAERIIITRDGKLPDTRRKIKHDPKNGIYVYELRKFVRSNAGTCFNQKPLVRKGQHVKKGQVIADGPCTKGGELALGRNVLVAFLPWSGYNFEDAIVISERLVKDDVFTSIHIEEFEVSARDTKLGPEEITRDIPNLGEDALKNLGPDGVIRIGAEVGPGDILVGKITPKGETELAPEERLLRAIFGEKAADVKDTSLRVPSGTYGIVMDVKVSAKQEPGREKGSSSHKQVKALKQEYDAKVEDLREQLTQALSNVLLGEKIPLDVVDGESGEIIIPANRKITKTLLRKLAEAYERIEIEPSPIRNKIMEIVAVYKKRFEDIQLQYEEELERLESGEHLDTGIIKSVRVYVATKRKISVGDKMAGRHGNKGVIAKIVKEEDMPFLADGTPVDIVLNPLGVPSRMNVGQVLETHLGWAAKLLGFSVATPVFDGITEEEIKEFLRQAALKQKEMGELPLVDDDGKTVLYDGRTGEPFDQRVVVGYIYMMKLCHMVADKIHARAVGPYSLVTQQPLGGKAQYGGQRFGEMEVWALEAYGAAYCLREMLTVKSDDIPGRTRIYESIVKGENLLDAGIPESFNVLVKEMQALGLDVRVVFAGPGGEQVEKRLLVESRVEAEQDV